MKKFILIFTFMFLLYALPSGEFFRTEEIVSIDCSRMPLYGWYFNINFRNGTTTKTWIEIDDNPEKILREIGQIIKSEKMYKESE